MCRVDVGVEVPKPFHIGHAGKQVSFPVSWSGDGLCAVKYIIDEYLVVVVDTRRHRANETRGRERGMERGEEGDTRK